MSTDAGSYTKCSAVEGDTDVVVTRPENVIYVEAERDQGAPADHPAVNIRKHSEWKSFYLSILGFVIAIFFFRAVCTSIDLFYVDVRPVTHIAKTAFAPACEGGCAAADKIVADELFKQSADNPREVVNTVIIPQMRPFAVTSCVEWSAGVYEIVAGSQTSKTRGTFQVDCAATNIAPHYKNFEYAEGYNFFHALGAPKIHHMDYLMKVRAVPVMTLLFAISSLSLVLQVAAVALRATLSESSIERTRMQCSACNGPNHVRHLTAAVACLLTLSLVMTIVEFVLCLYGSVPSDCGTGCVEDITVSAYYIYAVIGLILFHVAPLNLVYACCTMRV